MPRMNITVAICTWNRCQLLYQALEHMTFLRIPSALNWELLVVNNDCSDATDSVLTEFESRLPLKVSYEPQVGLSHARNRAIQDARGAHIIWTDDDVLVHENWLSAYAQAFTQHPQAAFYGGPVRPYFRTTPPDWLTDSWSLVGDRYGMCDWGSLPFAIKDSRRLPIGANFAIQTSCLRSYSFDPRLGHRRHLRIACEEIQLFEQLLDHGLEGWWVPDARVQHQIGPDRMTIAYLRKSYFDPARHAIGHSNKFKPISGFLELPHKVGRYGVRLIQAVVNELRYLSTRCIAPPIVWMKHLRKASMAWGRVLNRF
jgi:glycosyltransferase involved in cell wall biosynthesis